MRIIIKRPIITEKTLLLASRGWYTFMVDDKAEKPQVAVAVGRHYGVQVISVRMISMHGKMRRTGRRMVSVKKPDWKKAMVRLKKGQKIDVFEVTPSVDEKPVKEKTQKSEK